MYNLYIKELLFQVIQIILYKLISYKKVEYYLKDIFYYKIINLKSKHNIIKNIKEMSKK